MKAWMYDLLVACVIALIAGGVAFVVTKAVT